MTTLQAGPIACDIPRSSSRPERTRSWNFPSSKLSSQKALGSMASTSNPSEPLAPVLTKAPQSVPPMIDFLYSVPSPVTSELVALSPYISYIRQVAEITSWRSSWPKSWLALATWWAICLLAYPGLRYVNVFVPYYWQSHTNCLGFSSR